MEGDSWYEDLFSPSFDPISAEAICDGSDEIRLYIATWSDGAGSALEDYVMFADGERFLKIDGQCRFYAFEGIETKAMWDSEVYTGVLTLEEVDAISARLDTGAWAHFDEFDLTSGHREGHPAWGRFVHPEVANECQGSCQGRAGALIYYMRDIIEDVSKSGTPVVPTIVEFGLLEGSNSADRMIVSWGSDLVMDDVVDEPADFLGNGAGGMGSFVDSAAHPWFWETRQAYREATGDGLGTGIGIAGSEPGVMTHLMAVRPVTPQAWPDGPPVEPTL